MSLLPVRFTLLFGLLLWIASSTAHEIRPAVADVNLGQQGELSVSIRLNLEALIAEIGAEHTDTSESANAVQYDQLRKLSPEQLKQEFITFSPKLIAGIDIKVADMRLPLEISGISIAEVGDLDLARLSTVTLKAQSPVTASPLSWRWASSLGAIALRVSTAEQLDIYTAYLQPGQASAEIDLDTIVQQSKLSVAGNYMLIGFEHILPKGLDHILFVVGLFLLSVKVTTLLWQVTSFTLAHTVTLALGMLGVIQISPGIVEPLIAASIIYVCIENIYSDRLSRWRPFIVFAFGLLHGLGFAGVLSEIGLSSEHFVTGLVAFNIGVELGQLTVIALCYLLVGYWFGQKPWYRQRITIPASVVVAMVGTYWLLERTIL